MRKIISAFIAVAAVLSCRSEVPLAQGDWTPDAHAKISAMLKDCGKASRGYDASAKPSLTLTIPASSTMWRYLW